MVKKLKIQRAQFIHVIAILLVLIVSTIVGGKYFFKTIKEGYYGLLSYQLEKKRDKELQSYQCPVIAATIKVPGGKVCKTIIDKTAHQKIFDTYDFNSEGKEQIYKLFSEGNLDSADKIMNNQFPIDRYGVIEIQDEITWTEDPYKERYSRFLFFGLRPEKNLFFAFNTTHDTKYLNKAKEITESFVDNGLDQVHSWDDYHAVSFRTMFLVKTWWQLRENNLLTNKFSDKLLRAIEIHADFLADSNHYDKGYNHGLNEAAALYLVAVNFPDLDKNSTWYELSKKRINDGLFNVVDTDGVLTENSPYYHFYTLEKYWELYKYSLAWDKPISDNFNERLKKMISYAGYILQPNRRIPLLGASLDRYISNWGIYKDIGSEFPEFKYILTRGKEGKQPDKKNIIFPESGQVIIRSDWNKKEEFEKQIQLIFDSGPYRTLHSDFDALSFSLYNNGINLMPDSGLYTYDDDLYKNYFHGTSSHNTVLVDDKDQDLGSATLGEVIEKNNYVSVSGEHELYKGVSHKRSITVLDNKYILFVDFLYSDEDHDYKQLFHLYPGLQIKVDGLSVKAFLPSEKGDREVMNIHQIIPGDLKLTTHIDENNPINGICSVEYKKYLPCYALQYQQRGNNAVYYTLIELGEHDKHLEYALIDNRISINDSTKKFTIDLGVTEGASEQVIFQEKHLDNFNKYQITKIVNPNTSTWILDDKYKNYNLVFRSNEYINISTAADGTTQNIKFPTNMSLSAKNVNILLNATGVKNIEQIDLALTSNNWSGYISTSLKGIVRKEYENQWITISLGKGLKRDSGGQWKTYGSGFTWSQINGIGLSITSQKGNKSNIKLKEISAIPNYDSGEVIIIFDDGYDSILPALEIMDKYGFRGNIAVIGDRVQTNERGYLSLQQLKDIVNNYKWDIVNHSKHHLNALDSYYSTNKLDEFEKDLLEGAKFLTENGINTTPNWYIYPNGATNREIEKIVGKYYLFARTTITQSESYPFGEPLIVKTMSTGKSTNEGTQMFTSVDSIKKAVKDAKDFKLPLFITFHRIHSKSSDRPGYNIYEFAKIMKYISELGIKVKTLSEFDNDNGIKQHPLTFVNRNPSQIKTDIKVYNIPLYLKTKYLMGSIKESVTSWSI